MHLLYQSFGQEAGMQTYRSALESLVTSAVSPGTRVTLGSLPTALLEGKGFGSAHAVDTPKLLRQVAASVDGGVEGVAIGNAFDPGVWEARELFDVPVLGWFETVAFYGLRAGWRLGVLCSGPAGPARIEEMAARYGIGGRVLRPVSLGVRVPQVLAAFDDPGAAGRLVAQVEPAVHALEQAGAEVVMVASGILDVLLQVKGLRSLAGLSLLPGVQILARELEAAVNLAALGVPFVSRAGRFRQPPDQVQRAVRED